MKKKQFYEKPSMKVVELKQQPTLLQASATLQDYTFENETPE